MKKVLSSVLAVQLVLLLATSCNTAPIMEESYYTRVEKGVEISSIEKVYGYLYQVRNCRRMAGAFYMQRIALGNSAVEQTEFVFLVDKGKVVGKDCKRNGTSCFQFSQ